MTITTRFYEVNKGNVKASCSICIDDKLVIKGFNVMRNSKDNSLFISFPSVKVGDEYVNTVYCLNKDYFNSLSRLILDNYKATQEKPDTL